MFTPSFGAFDFAWECVFRNAYLDTLIFAYIVQYANRVLGSFQKCLSQWRISICTEHTHDVFNKYPMEWKGSFYHCHMTLPYEDNGLNTFKFMRFEWCDESIFQRTNLMWIGDASLFSFQVLTCSVRIHSWYKH